MIAREARFRKPGRQEQVPLAGCAMVLGLYYIFEILAPVNHCDDLDRLFQDPIYDSIRWLDQLSEVRVWEFLHGPAERRIVERLL